MTEQNVDRKNFVSIQYLRAIAALIVVFHHALTPSPWLYIPFKSFGAGQAGVDVFFVISGFIMYSAARNEKVVDFARRRFIRIAPLYWLVTLVTLFVFERSRTAHLSSEIINHVVLSIGFIPHYSLDHPREIWPYLVPGWTLNYEMFFYILFGLSLLTQRIVPALSVTIGFLIAIGLAMPSRNALWATYTAPILAEFLGGVLIAKYQRYLVGLPWLLPLGVIGLLASELVALPRVIEWGIPAAAMVTGAVAIERAGKLPHWAILKILGDASYSIYLFQVLAIWLATGVMKRIPLSGLPQFLLMEGLALVTASTIGVFAYRFIERPMTHRLSGPSRRHRLATAAAVSRRP